MGQWTPRAPTATTQADVTKVGNWLHQIELRPGERFIQRVVPSQLTNFSLFLTLTIAITFSIAGLAQGASPIGFFNGVLYLVSFALYFKRMMPFWYITDERVVQVTLNDASSFVETAVDLNRITSVVKRDPIFGATLRIQGLDVFVAEGAKPKLSIRFLRNADAIQTLLSPSRR